MKLFLYKTLLVVLTLVMIGDSVGRSIIPALSGRKNDFTDPWIGAWLWRHGQNPYDVELASAASTQFVDHGGPMVPIYPASTYLLLTAFSFMSWKMATVLWGIVNLVGVALVALVLLRIGRFNSKDIRSWAMVAIVFSLTPLRAGLVMENPAIISISLSLLAVYLASEDHDLSAGIVLAMATALKPQLGIWIVVFYLIRRRWRLSVSCLSAGVAITTVALARIPLSFSRLRGNYSDNLRHWFGPGCPNDFSIANPARFSMVNLQVLLAPMTGHAANLIALALAAVGMSIWLWAVRRNPSCSEALALGSLLALSLLPVYHRAYDLGILTLTLCWALSRSTESSVLLRRSSLVLLLLFMIPERLTIMLSDRYLSGALRVSVWWNIIVLPRVVILLILNIVLLCALTELKRRNDRDTILASSMAIPQLV